MMKVGLCNVAALIGSCFGALLGGHSVFVSVGSGLAGFALALKPTLLLDHNPWGVMPDNSTTLTNPPMHVLQ